MESNARASSAAAGGENSAEWRYFTHYLRNTLGVLGTISDYYLAHPPNAEELSKLLLQLKKTSKESDLYISAFAELSEPVAASRTPFSLASWLKSRVEGHPVSRKPGVRLELKLPAESETVEADAALLGRALDAVLDNAADAMPEKGSLDVAAWFDGGTALISVRNSGPHISPSVLPDIGKPFLTLKSGHVGLGLSRARRVLLAHDGDIAAVNSPGGVQIILRFARRSGGTT